MEAEFAFIIERNINIYIRVNGRLFLRGIGGGNLTATEYEALLNAEDIFWYVTENRPRCIRYIIEGLPLQEARPVNRHDVTEDLEMIFNAFTRGNRQQHRYGVKIIYLVEEYALRDESEGYSIGEPEPNNYDSESSSDGGPEPNGEPNNYDSESSSDGEPEPNGEPNNYDSESEQSGEPEPNGEPYFDSCPDGDNPNNVDDDQDGRRANNVDNNIIMDMAEHIRRRYGPEYRRIDNVPIIMPIHEAKEIFEHAYLDSLVYVRSTNNLFDTNHEGLRSIMNSSLDYRHFFGVLDLLYHHKIVCGEYTTANLRSQYANGHDFHLMIEMSLNENNFATDSYGLYGNYQSNRLYNLFGIASHYADRNQYPYFFFGLNSE